MQEEKQKMKRILLVDPLPNDFRMGMKKMYPSGALILIGTMCQERGHRVKIIDMIAEEASIAKLKKFVLSFKPNIVGITMNTFQTKNAKEVVKAIKEINKNILVVIGGSHPSALKLRIFEDFNNVDISVIGEGEFTFMEIIEGKELDGIKGICYSSKINELRPLAEDLDYIPLPNLDLVDVDKYTMGVDGINQKGMFIMASRGCPFRCTYCNKSVFGYKIRYRKPDKIIEEIKWLYAKYAGISEIFFQDDTLNLNRAWIKEILNLIIENGLNKDVKYIAAFRANKKLIDVDLLELAKKAGFKRIFYGVESGDQGMLNRMKKDLTIYEIERAVKLAHTVGIQTYTSFILGLPGENKATIKNTITLSKKLKPSEMGIAVATPFPNTPFEKEIKKKGHLFVQNYDEYQYGGNYIRTDELTNEEIDFFSFVVPYGFQHRWVFLLPIFRMARHNFFRSGLKTIRKMRGMINEA